MAAGGALLLAPTITFGLLFDAAAVPEPWVRVGGVLFATFGLQYFGTGLCDVAPMPPATSFYHASIGSRCFLATAFAAVAALHTNIRVGLLVLASVNLLGALSMRLALSKDAAAAHSKATATAA